MNRNQLVVAPMLTALCGAASATATFTGYTTAQQLFCNMPTISGQFSSKDARYSASGLCKMVAAQQDDAKKRGESTFDSFNNATEVYRFNWTATGSYNPVTKVTVEELIAPPPQVDQRTPGNRPYGRFTLETICETDPWLDENARCAAARTTVTGNLGDAQKALQYSGRPFSAPFRYDQTALRLALRKTRDQQMAMYGSVKDASPTLQTAPRTATGATTYSPGAATSSTAAGVAAGSIAAAPYTSGAASSSRVAAATASTPTPTLGKRKLPSSGGAGSESAPAAPAAASTPPPATSAAPAATPTAPAAPVQAVPQILSPGPGAPQLAGQMRVQVKPAPGTEAAMGEVEFVWMAPRPGETNDRPPQAPMPLRWQAPMAQLAQGVVLPAGSGPTTSGRWQMRVHATTANSPWSVPVMFDFAVPSNVAQAGAGAMPSHSQAMQTPAARALEQKGLNPQPLPPREDKANPAQRSALNPQPLPPKQSNAPGSAFSR